MTHHPQVLADHDLRHLQDAEMHRADIVFDWLRFGRAVEQAVLSRIVVPHATPDHFIDGAPCVSEARVRLREMEAFRTGVRYLIARYDRELKGIDLREEMLADGFSQAGIYYPGPASTPVPVANPTTGWVCYGGTFHPMSVEKCHDCGELRRAAILRVNTRDKAFDLSSVEIHRTPRT